MTVVLSEFPTSEMSLYAESLKEAYRHKWIESEKQGRDLGEQAVRQWYDKYWNIYCRLKRIEHVVGQQVLQEFNDPPSPYILDLLRANDLLLQLILDRVCEGWENLGLIVWGQHWGLPMYRVRNILHELNINCARLDPDPVLALEVSGE